MEYISKKLTDYILNKGMITEELTEVYEYGFQCFLEFSLSTLCSIIIAIFLNMLPECLFFFLIFIPMRSFGGGVHMKTYLACFIGSCLLLTSTMLAVKYLSVPIYFFFGIVYNFCYLSYDNQTCESSESRSGLPREPYLHAEDIPHTATQPYMCCIFYLH